MKFEKLYRANYFQLTDDFNLIELICPCCNRVIIVPLLVWILQNIRTELESRLFIISGFRCAKWNKRKGGGKASYHLTGEAADAKSKVVTPEKLFITATGQVDVNGLGIYLDGHVHIDIRKSRRLFWVGWLEDIGKRTIKKYKYFSTPEATLAYYSEKMAVIKGPN